MTTLVESFMRLFRGLDRAYGAYILSNRPVQSGKKVLGRPATKREPVTEELWDAHLSGRSGLGIVPIRDDSTCFFGAIDVDIYEGYDIESKVKFILDHDLPLVPCRSKSGGLHCFTFLKEPIPAALMREKLSAFAAAMGHGDAEIFPKQTEILYERGDIGQWINIPYYKASKTDRYAHSIKDGKLFKMTAKQFIEYANSKAMTAKEFSAYTIHVTGDISDGPPCLQHLLTQKISEGGRNDALFGLGVYLKKVFPTDWKNRIDDYNMRYVIPPLASSEIHMIVGSLDKKEYLYPCDKIPMKAFCDKGVCRTRTHGISGIGMLTLTGLTKYSSTPPVWFVDVEGIGRLELSTTDLQNQAAFQRRCMDGLNLMPPIFKEKVWRSLISDLLENVSIIEAPPEASPKGIMFDYLEKFCTSRAQAKVAEEMRFGKPWTKDGYHYFRLLDFRDFLERNRFYDFKSNQIASMLHDAGAEREFFRFGSIGINTWKIQEFQKQKEDIKLPDLGEEVF